MWGDPPWLDLKPLGWHPLFAHLPHMPTKILLEAIARKNCIEAVYNRSAVKLAPHILYTRHGEIYLDAVTMARDGKPPREVKIGSRSEEHTSELQSLMRISYAVFCLQKKRISMMTQNRIHLT